MPAISPSLHFAELLSGVEQWTTMLCPTPLACMPLETWHLGLSTA